MLRNVIFDWSGTLVDDLPAVLEASNHVFRLAGVPEMDLASFRAQFSLPFQDFYDGYIPNVPLPQLEAWFHERFRLVQDNVRELPHAREFLEFCRQQGLKTFLLSTIHGEHYHRQAERHRLNDYLDHVYVEVPDKRVRILELLRVHQLNPRETVFVGDMQHDIEAAAAGGVFSCAVLTGYNRLDQLKASCPDVIVEHLGELRRLLEEHRLDFAAVVVDRRDSQRPVATVGALILDSEDQVLLVRTRKWSDRWGIPGGKIQFGERAEEALRREIREETALEIEAIEWVMVQDCIHSPEFYRDAHFLLLNYRARLSGPAKVVLNDEAQASCWVTPAAAWSMDLNQPTRVLLARVYPAVTATPPLIHSRL
jgi:phosphoglycolate phosphatase-like HAD superfamily hydrolase/ADP-ribose pyrophosphatase YjhB (NUDIX family)